jgi:uncharacterized protein YeaC (DUF1315 family)
LVSKQDEYFGERKVEIGKWDDASTNCSQQKLGMQAFMMA